MQIKGPFTFYSYGWTATELGPFMSLMAVCKGFVLVVLIPGKSSLVSPQFRH